MSLFFNKRRISRTNEWDDSTIRRKHIQRERGRRRINSQSTRQETRSWTKISFTRRSIRIFGIFCNFLDERFAEEDLSEILDAGGEIARLKIPPLIPAHLEFIPTNIGDLESEEEKRARIQAQILADKSYASKEASHLEGLKKLKQKFNRAIILVLKHVDAQINLDLHQFLKSDPIKKLDPEAKYKSIRKHFSKHWGPHSSLDVTMKIKQELTEMQGDDPGWRKYIQTSITSLDRWSKQCNAIPIMQLSTDLHQQLYTLQGHQQQPQPHSSKLTLKRAKQRTNSATHSFHKADQR